MISTLADCKPSGRNAPSSSWSMFERCRRSWPGCTSAWMYAGKRRTRKRKSTESLKGCLKNRRRPWRTATWTSCLATWKILVILYRNCTWQRMLSLRSSQLHRCRTQAYTALSCSSNCDFVPGGAHPYFQLQGRLRQEDHKFKAILCHLARPWFKIKILIKGWGCSSVAEGLTSTCKALGSSPRTGGKKQNKTKNLTLRTRVSQPPRCYEVGERSMELNQKLKSGFVSSFPSWRLSLQNEISVSMKGLECVLQRQLGRS